MIVLARTAPAPPLSGAVMLAVVENPSSVTSPAPAEPKAGFGRMRPGCAPSGARRRSIGSGAEPFVLSTSTTTPCEGAMVNVIMLMSSENDPAPNAPSKTGLSWR